MDDKNHMILKQIETVVFDVGETLIDESRLWQGWARYLGVPAEEFRKILDGTIARGEHHRQALYHFQPNLDLEAARLARERDGDSDLFDKTDLYPDALPCLTVLRSLNLRIGIAGNQPLRAEQALMSIGLCADFIASSARWGVAKPDHAFFERTIELCGCPPASVAYVGDRLDNDVIPARKAGMTTIFVERGPWGRVHAQWPEVDFAHLRVATLQELSRLFSHAHGRLN